MFLGRAEVAKDAVDSSIYLVQFYRLRVLIWSVKGGLRFIRSNAFLESFERIDEPQLDRSTKWDIMDPLVSLGDGIIPSVTGPCGYF